MKVHYTTLIYIKESNPYHIFHKKYTILLHTITSKFTIIGFIRLKILWPRLEHKILVKQILTVGLILTVPYYLFSHNDFSYITS